MLDLWLCAGYVLTSALAYALYLFIYRCYLHPLSGVPGPFFAAITDHYATYFDLVKDGALIEQLQRLHKIYGPVVRIGPNSLHFSNPDVYNKIYSRGTTFLKDPALYRAFPDHSGFSTIDPVLAKSRRDAISSFFSRRSIAKLEPFVREKIDKLTDKLLNSHDPSEPVDILRALKAATLDIIYSYCFGEDCGALDAPDFQHPIIVGTESANQHTLTFKAFPILCYVRLLANKLPWLFGKLVPGHALLVLKLSTQISGLLADPSALEDAPHETIFHSLMVRPKGAAMPSREELLDEALTLQIAGSHTVAATCYMGFYHILANHNIHRMLFAELREAVPDPKDLIRFEIAEKLPYLTAVIKESLRLSHGVVSPMLRNVNADGVVLDGLAVPRGTTVAIGNSFVHLNAELFPNPDLFDPERWLQDKTGTLETYLVAFSKGQRNCLGLNLAWCELYLIFASVFRRLDLELRDSSPKDMEYSAHFVTTFRGRPIRAFVKAISS